MAHTLEENILSSSAEISSLLQHDHRGISPAIEVANLSVSYGQVPAFRDISLNFNRCCVTALVGPSGCGKTSFLNCLNRLNDLTPECAVTGQVRIDSEEIYSRDTDVQKLRRRVGMIFQKPTPFPISIRNNLLLPLTELGISVKSEKNAIMESVLTKVGLWNEVKDRLDQPAQALSGGQQQRLCIARALALEPEIMLLDEPCSNLDPISSGVVEDLIVELGKLYTVIIVTHNLAQARRIASYTALLWVQDGAGQLVEYGTSQQLFESPKHPITAAYISGARG